MPTTSAKFFTAFCARVMCFCNAVGDANELTYLEGLRKEAARLKAEARLAQSYAIRIAHPEEDHEPPSEDISDIL